MPYTKLTSQRMRSYDLHTNLTSRGFAFQDTVVPCSIDIGHKHSRVAFSQLSSPPGALLLVIDSEKYGC